jgi:excisionase family DNA binding protein
MTNPPQSNRTHESSPNRSLSSQVSPTAASAPTRVETMKPGENRLYTVKEAAYHLHVSTDTIRRLIARGDLPCVVIGMRSLRIVPHDLREYVLRNKRRIASPRSSGTSPSSVKH